MLRNVETGIDNSEGAIEIGPEYFNYRSSKQPRKKAPELPTHTHRKKSNRKEIPGTNYSEQSTLITDIQIERIVCGRNLELFVTIRVNETVSKVSGTLSNILWRNLGPVITSNCIFWLEQNDYTILYEKFCKLLQQRWVLKGENLDDVLISDQAESMIGELLSKVSVAVNSMIAITDKDQDFSVILTEPHAEI